MRNKLIPIACFALALSACGCLEQTSSHSAAAAKSGTLTAATTANKGIAIINPSAHSEENNSTVIAYYFHRTIRCPACLAIEVNAQRVIETGFTDQIADEKLMWIPFNLDEPGGEDFEKEFDVSFSTLILAKIRSGNDTNYKKLEKIWDFIGNPVEFEEYVQSEVRQFLNE